MCTKTIIICPTKFQRTDHHGTVLCSDINASDEVNIKRQAILFFRVQFFFSAIDSDEFRAGLQIDTIQGPEEQPRHQGQLWFCIGMFVQ